jgi:ribonuclease T
MAAFKKLISKFGLWPTKMVNERFRSYLPVIVDIETAGFDAKKNPLLEIAAVIVEYDSNQQLQITESHAAHMFLYL